MNAPADQAYGVDRAHIAAALTQLGDDTPERIWFPIEADRAFGEGPEADQ